MKKVLFAKIMRERRIAIPKELMKEYNLNEGCFVLFEQEEDGFKIIPAIVVEK